MDLNSHRLPPSITKKLTNQVYICICIYIKSGKQKPNFATGSTITKVNIEHLEKVAKTFLRNVFTRSIVSINTVELIIGIL